MRTGLLNKLNNAGGFSGRGSGTGVLAEPEYRIFEDENGLQWRQGIRDGYIVLDVALTATGFSGTEDLDWENVEKTAYLTIPTDFTLVWDGDYMKLDWVSDYAVYIERSTTDETNYAYLTTVNAGTLTYTDQTVDVNEEYYYRIKAVIGSIEGPFGTGVWSNINSLLWYGYELDEANSSPDVTRIAGAGKMAYHASLPVQSLMKGCIINDSGAVQYYLKSDDWSKKADGSASVLDGTDGQVMVEMPKFYHKIENPSSGVYRHKISLFPISSFTEIPKF